MGRSYSAEMIRQKLISVLGGSEAGMMTGVAIARQMGISRTTLAKYLDVFAAEGGFLQQRSIGNATLWSLEPGQEAYDFPDDYFRVASMYLERLTKGTEDQALALVRNCLHSGADAGRLVVEAVLPAIAAVRALYDDGKIGAAEQSLLRTAISRSLQAMDSQRQPDPDPKKNVIVIAADRQSVPDSEAASAVYRSEGWTVHHLGDMSHSINVLFDLDLQKLLGRVWRRRPGIMVVAVFSDTGEGLRFFADATNTIRTRSAKRIRLALCGRAPSGDGAKIRSDLLSGRVEDILQWSRTVSAGIR